MINVKKEAAMTAIKIHYLTEVCGLLTYDSLYLLRSSGMIKNHVNRIRQSANAIKTSLIIDNIKEKEGASEAVFDENSDLYLLINNIFNLGLSNLASINLILKEKLQERDNQKANDQFL